VAALNNPDFLAALLSRELRQVDPPDFLWDRVRAAIICPAPKRQLSLVHVAWGLAAATILTCTLIPTSLSHRHREAVLDLGPYLAPVQSSAAADSSPAIYHSPPNFASTELTIAPARLDGYSVAAQRVLTMDNARVEQFVYDGGGAPVSLFVVPQGLKIAYGSEQAYEESIFGVPCRRLNCRKQRTLEFPCAAATCVLVCKACSEALLASLIQQITNSLPVAR